MRDKEKKLLQFQADEEVARKIELIAAKHHSSIAGAISFIVEDWFRLTERTEAPRRRIVASDIGRKSRPEEGRQEKSA